MSSREVPSANSQLKAHYTSSMQQIRLEDILTHLRSSIGVTMSSFHDIKATPPDATENDIYGDQFQRLQTRLESQWKPIISFLKRCHPFSEDVNYLRSLVVSQSDSDIQVAIEELILQSESLANEAEELKTNWKSIDFSYSSNLDEMSEKSRGQRRLIEGSNRQSIHYDRSPRSREPSAHESRAMSDFYAAQEDAKNAIALLAEFWKHCDQQIQQLSRRTTWTREDAMRMMDMWPRYEEEIAKTMTELGRICEAVRIKPVHRSKKSPVKPEEAVGWKLRDLGLGAIGGLICGAWFTQSPGTPEVQTSTYSQEVHPSPETPYIISQLPHTNVGPMSESSSLRTWTPVEYGGTHEEYPLSQNRDGWLTAFQAYGWKANPINTIGTKLVDPPHSPPVESPEID